MKFTILMALVLLLCAGSVFAMDMKGLVMYLSFNEGSGTTAKDASGNKNDGVLMGKVDWVAGKYGKAVKIDAGAAENFVSVKANATLDMTDKMTFGAWVNIEAMPDNNCSLITKADTYMFHMSDWSGNGIEVEPLLWPFDAWQTPISAPIQLNEWHHVMGTFDGTNLSNYIDGKLTASRVFAGPIPVTTNDVVIGRDSRSCCNTRKATMTVDDAVIFNRAISAGEVQELMAGNLTPVTPQSRATTLWGQLKSQ